MQIAQINAENVSELSTTNKSYFIPKNDEMFFLLFKNSVENVKKTLILRI